MDGMEAEAMSHLLRTAAIRLTEARDPNERALFALGPEIRVAWGRWDTAYPERPPGSLGTASASIDELYHWRVDTPGESFSPERTEQLLR